MKILKVNYNNKRKCIFIDTKKGELFLPYAKLRLKPSSKNKITNLYIDEELGHEAVTYCLENGKEDSIHVDAFLDFNRDPELLKNNLLHEMTLRAIKEVKNSKLSLSDIARILRTSRAQLDRLLDPANYNKSIDELIKLLFVLGQEVSFKTKSA